MSDDRINTQIQALMVELIDSTPPAPTWDSIQARLDQARPTAPTTDESGIITLPGAGTADEPEGMIDLPEYTRHVEKRRPRWRPIAAAGGAAAILVGGTFAYAAFVGDDGADTPEAAVEQFVDSLADEDAIGVFESLPPSERSLVTEAMSDLSAEAARLGLTEGLDLNDVGGFDFEVDGLTLEPETLGEGVVAVHLDGTFVSQSTGAELPLGTAVRDSLTNTSDGNTAYQDFENEVASLEGVFDREDVFVVAIKEDGGWHVSSWYTIAEYLRRANDQPLPTFGGSVLPPVGAATPDEAVQSFIAAALNNDLQGALQLALPGESRVLYDYGPLFLDEAQQSNSELPRQTVINSLDLVDSGDGDTRSVSLEGYDYTVQSSASAVGNSYGSSRQIFDGECFSTTYTPPASGGEPYDEQYCRADADHEGTQVEWDLTVGADYIVVQRDGRWYLSPVRSMVATILAGAHRIPDAAAAREVVNGPGIWLVFPGRIFNLLGGYNGYYGGGSDGTYDNCVTEIAEDGTETEVCEPAASTTFEQTGVPVDENGNPLPTIVTTATTVAMASTTMVPESTPPIVDTETPATTGPAATTPAEP